MIRYWLNSIDCEVITDCPKHNERVVWVFRGDGTDAHEKEASVATKAVIGDYIDYCKDQIELAQKYLEEVE